jgi:hypothetical protein
LRTLKVFAGLMIGANIGGWDALFEQGDQLPVFFLLGGADANII